MSCPCKNSCKCKKSSGRGLALAGQYKSYSHKGQGLPAAAKHPEVIGASIYKAFDHLATKLQRGKGMQQGQGLQLIKNKVLSHIQKALKLAKVEHAHAQLKKHANVALHAAHVFGKNWKTVGPRFIKKIISLAHKGKGMTRGGQLGEGIFSSIGKVFKKGYKSIKGVRDKAIGTLKDFVAGKTKFKPSKLLSILGTAATVAGTVSSVIPGVNLIGPEAAAAASTALGAASKLAKSTGRGLKVPGSGYGEGLSPAGGGGYGEGLPYGVSLTGRGKVKRDRYAVFHGFYDTTRGGLGKDSFFLRGNKVISKKRSALGKRNAQAGKGCCAKRSA